MDVAHPLDLDGILDRLAESYRRILLDDSPFDGIGLQEMVQIVIQRGRIYCQTRDQPILHLTGKGDGHVVVRQYGYAVIQEFQE